MFTYSKIGGENAYDEFENLEVYKLSEALADDIWGIVVKWGFLRQRDGGKQIVRSADSIGANIAEGTGRGTYKDNRRFIRVARGSLYETRHWLRRAYKRKLLSEEQVNKLKPIIQDLAPRLNAYLRSIGNASSKQMTS